MTVYATPDRDGSTVRVIRRCGHLACVGCELMQQAAGARPPEPFTFEADGIPTMLDHLDLHVALGDTVPLSAFERLRHEHRDNLEKGER